MAVHLCEQDPDGLVCDDDFDLRHGSRSVHACFHPGIHHRDHADHFVHNSHLGAQDPVVEAVPDKVDTAVEDNELPWDHGGMVDRIRRLQVVVSLHAHT